MGYRRLKGRPGKPAGAGKWVLRHYLGGQAYVVETIGNADDYSDPDGVAILSFSEAQAKARERMVRRAHHAAGKRGPLTVKEASKTISTIWIVAAVPAGMPAIGPKRRFTRHWATSRSRA